METNASQGIEVVIQALRGGGQPHGSVGAQANDGGIDQLSDATRERSRVFFGNAWPMRCGSVWQRRSGSACAS
jgi:hypothetical protein